eukprot:Skav211352  [mRNA]  locus=scaffold3500:36670:52914:- [translate_table: standard]
MAAGETILKRTACTPPIPLGPGAMAAQWLASGAGKVFQSLGQCKGEERRRELVAQLGQSENAEDAFQQSAVTLWSMLLDAHKAKKFQAAEASVLPVLSLCLASRVEKLLGTAPPLELNEATLSGQGHGLGRDRGMGCHECWILKAIPPRPATLPLALQSAKEALNAFASPTGQGFATWQQVPQL